MPTLTYDSRDYEMDGAGVYYREAKESEGEREFVVNFTIDVENLNTKLLESFHDDHGTEREYRADVGGISYKGVFTKTTVTNQEHTDPQTGESVQQLEVALIADADDVIVGLL